MFAFLSLLVHPLFLVSALLQCVWWTFIFWSYPLSGHRPSSHYGQQPSAWLWLAVEARTRYWNVQVFCWATDKSSRVGCQPSAQLATLTVNQLFSGVLRNFSQQVKGGKKQEDLLMTVEQKLQAQISRKNVGRLWFKNVLKTMPLNRKLLYWCFNVLKLDCCQHNLLF